jgi:hypothetical protein
VEQLPSFHSSVELTLVLVPAGYLDFCLQPHGEIVGLNERLTDVDLTGNRLKTLPDGFSCLT